MPDVDRRRATAVVTAVLALILLVGVALADPQPRDRVADLAARLRCPVCQAESVADSPSDTARAMESRIADLVADGRTDAEIVDFFVDRYGDWVLLDPPARGANLALWIAPALAGVAGVGLIAATVRSRRDG